MGGNAMMEKRGHHICKMVNYNVRQKITQETSRKVGGKLVSTPGSSEVMIYKGKEKIEGDMKDIKKVFIDFLDKYDDGNCADNH